MVTQVVMHSWLIPQFHGPSRPCKLTPGIVTAGLARRMSAIAQSLCEGLSPNRHAMVDRQTMPPPTVDFWNALARRVLVATSFFYPNASTKKVLPTFGLVAEGTCPEQVGSAEQCFTAAPKLGINATRFLNKRTSDEKLPAGCSVSLSPQDGSATVFFNDGGKDECTIGTQRVGQVTAWNIYDAAPVGENITLGLEIDGAQNRQEGGIVKISMTGPADKWFGIGFNASFMRDSPYAVIVNSSGAFEQHIGTCGSEAEHCPGDRLAPMITVISNTEENGRRTVVMTRPVVGITENHYSFDHAAATIPLIIAVGWDQTFAYHAGHRAAEISIVSADGTPQCVCDLGELGAICEYGGARCTTWKKDCYDESRGGELVKLHNPTCNSGQYAGGLMCGQHGRFLLDNEQKVESLTRPTLKYHIKMRFWFQECTAGSKPSHYNLERYYWQTEARAGEFDVPPAFPKKDLPIPGYPNLPLDKPTPGTTCTGTCPDGPDCDCVHTLVFRWTIDNKRLIYISGHCHAPACINMTFYQNVSGELKLLCAIIPKYGNGSFPSDKFDEEGYLLLPPCLFGEFDGDQGLDAAPWMPEGSQVVGIEHNHNTHVGHYGQMGSWQMRGVSFPASSSLMI